MKRALTFVLLLALTFYFGYNFYYANIHSHTSYSDGAGTPQEAYAHAANYVDVLAVTDHAYYFVEKIDGQDKLLLTKLAAKKATKNGRFVGLWGFEWTGGVGHINVYGTDDWISRNDVDLFGLYKWIVERQALAQFNHPITTFGTFYDFEYDPLVDEYLNLVEVGNGSWRGRTISDEMLSNFVVALNKGWHVGATANQDNHRPEWGSANDTRTVILATELTYESVMDALKNRRVYASEDRNAKLIFEANQYPMGSILQNTWSVNFRIYLSDDENFQDVYLISQSGTLMQWKVNDKEFETFYSCNVPDVFEWFYVYAIQQDGNRIVSSPIWVHNSDVYAVNTKVTVTGKTADLHMDLVNYGFETRNVYILAKVSNQTQSFQMSLQPKEKKPIKITFSNLESGTQKLELFIDQKPAFSQEIELKTFTILLDESHENSYPQLKTVLTKQMSSFADVQLNSRYLRKIPAGVNLIVLPLPKDGSFKETSMLNNFEIDVLVNYAKNGGKILLVAFANSTFDESYQKLLEKLGINGMLIKKEKGVFLETEKLLDEFSIDCLRFVLLEDVSKFVEIIKGMIEK